MPGRAGRIPQFQLGVVSLAWNPSMCKVEAGGPDVQGCLWLHNKYKASLNCKICLKFFLDLFLYMCVCVYV